MFVKKIFFIIIITISTIFFVSCYRKADQSKQLDHVRGNHQQPALTKQNNVQTHKYGHGDHVFSLHIGGLTRKYILYVPESYNSESATPLVVVFHGGLGNAETMMKFYGWVEKSEKEGFIVAFPNGASRLDSGKFATWNAGRCCGYAVENNSDDISFVRAVIEDVKSKVNVSKIFATGMSNGGMLSHRLACEMSDVLIAVAAVAGTNNYDTCYPEKAISVMHIHGLQDDHVLYNGGCGPECVIDAETEFTSVPDTLAGWIKRNSCTDSPKRVLENQNGYCDLYLECENSVQVKLCVAKDGGHAWPGSALSLNVLEKTKSSQSFSATDEIWNFFKNQR